MAMILEHAVSKADLQVYDLTTVSFHHLWNRDWQEEAENLDKVVESMKPRMICSAGTGAPSHESASLKDGGKSWGRNPFALMCRFILFLAFSANKDVRGQQSWQLNPKHKPSNWLQKWRLRNNWQMLFLSVFKDPNWADSTSQTGCPPKSGYTSPIPRKTPQDLRPPSGLCLLRMIETES